MAVEYACKFYCPSQIRDLQKNILNETSKLSILPVSYMGSKVIFLK